MTDANAHGGVVADARGRLQQEVVKANAAAAQIVAIEAGDDKPDVRSLAGLETIEDTLDVGALARIAAAEQTAVDAVEKQASAVGDAKRQQSQQVAQRFTRGATGVGVAVVAASWLWALLSTDGTWQLPTAVTIVVIGLIVLGTALSGQGLLGVLIGADGRLSTSRTAAAAWTVTLVFALLYFALAQPDPDEFELDETYLLVLGGPYAAWVLTGSLTRAKIANRQLQKTGSVQTQPVRDLVSDDNGELSLTDLQYLGFGLVALVYFYVAFLSMPGPTTMPELPPGLVFLTSAGALTYLGSKSVQANAPFITTVLPPSGRTQVKAGRRVVVTGGNFVPPGAGGDLDTLTGVRVRFRQGEHERIIAVIPRMRAAPPEGTPEPPPHVRQEATNPTTARLSVRIPIDLDGLLDVSVITLAGVETPAFPVCVERASETAKS